MGVVDEHRPELLGHVYTTERPATTFVDVAGYDAVKDDIREVVDFLRTRGAFARSAPASRRASCSSGRPVPGRR